MNPNRWPEAVRGSITAFCFSLLVFLTACQSDQPASPYPSTEGLAAAREAQVQTPASTPYDDSPQQRQVYLEAYADGYRSGLTGMNILFRKPNDAASTVRIRGWRDGADAGLKEYFFRKNKR